jgi:hypothetical protein
MPGNPISTEALVSKFQDCLEYGGKRDDLAKSIADELLEIDACPNIRLICEKLGE